MSGVFRDCIVNDADIRCPGDDGYSTVTVFGETRRLRKDDPAIEMMGRLDELEALAEWGYVVTKDPVFAGISIIATSLNTYLSTGDSSWLEYARQVIKEGCKLSPSKLGWFIPADETTAILNLIRVKAREAERTAVRMLDSYPKDKVHTLIAELNQANKYIAQLIYVKTKEVFSKIQEKLDTLSQMQNRHASRTEQ